MRIPVRTSSMLYVLLISLFAVALPAAADAPGADGPESDVKDVIKRTFQVRPGGTLDLDLDHGNVDISTGRDDEVVVEVERRVEASDREEAKRILERHRVAFDQDDSDVEIESRFDGDEGFWGSRNRNKFKVHIRIRVPSRYNVEFKSGAGNIQVAALEGEVIGRTGAGNIEIGAVRGPVDVSSGAGNVEIRRAVGYVEASSGAGNISLHDVRGTVDAKTGAGNVMAIITQQPDRESNLQSGAGNVTVAVSDGIGFYVDAVASLGSASTDFPLEIEGKWMKKSFEGEVNGGGPQITMRTGVGNVSLKRN